MKKTAPRADLSPDGPGVILPDGSGTLGGTDDSAAGAAHGYVDGRRRRAHQFSPIGSHRSANQPQVHR